MKSKDKFSVDPRFSALLGESYTSSDRGLRELVDYAWDAESRLVEIALQEIVCSEQVVIRDDGHDIKNQKFRQEYRKMPASGSAARPNGRLIENQKSTHLSKIMHSSATSWNQNFMMVSVCE